ncbi:RNA polymerase 2 mediator complex component [Sporothrix schenckii 1099-18]|uniref:RNA polymerase 2 mediator complex component n=1 Tax=Sporothrix schenckii 1099-18 TaxID=1397361 RepID=A0A0F2M5Z7_SPOSC|nr:RNA polymerase 2 mediator complex component [Sporothrix schenckii 1099-18]KJR83606.1 RNA polymerase 2 mediator complex component [Sporothrix schenckii 1099-18]
MFALPKAPACTACARAKPKPSSYVALRQEAETDVLLPTTNNTNSNGLFGGLFLGSVDDAMPAVPNAASLDLGLLDNTASTSGTIDPTSALSHFSWLLETPKSLDLQVGLFQPLPQPAPWFPSQSTTLIAPSHAQLWPPKTSWFLLPATWSIDHRVHLHHHASSTSTAFLRLQVAGIRTWLRTWVATGGCPFIHPNVYGNNGNKDNTPACVQVAFLAMSSYIHRTEATTEMVLDAVDAQASQLVAPGGEATDASTTTLLAQLGRVHALVVYQAIGLFDGNTRARHRADLRRSTLARWSGQLLEAAQQQGAVAERPLTPVVSIVDDLDHNNNDRSDNINAWHAWIVAESIRRMWTISTAIEAIYHTLQHAWSPATGSLPFTARYGLWQARSAAEWETARSADGNTNSWLYSLHDLGCLIDAADAADVDVFSRGLMSSAYGRDRVIQWEKSSRERRLTNSHDR